MFNMQNELSSLEYGKGVTLTQRDSDFNTISTKGKVITDKSGARKFFGSYYSETVIKKMLPSFFVRNDTFCSTALIVII